ncbi:[Fe-S]-binding protein [Erysipelothrix larvae]|uniref:[Fe-S]-binding protein n=1 Tax=Erysipelothrix larvae TaxID=1514105 RepID=A0A0X8H050_9FIRM|nr:Rrf2 family transcriptional regulator [Erysipelothrix larvae]AMC93559.1 [Fe-S]-binding protein [Erysipelothrix larvae]
MKLSAKSRYGIAALVYLHVQNETTSLISIANHLNISKIYMEQVFSSLRSAGIVEAIKGPNGGYYMKSSEYSMFDIINILEPEMLKKTQASTDDNTINQVLCENFYSIVDAHLSELLKGILIKDIAEKVKNYNSNEPMYYI